MRFTCEDGSEWEPYTGSTGISGIKLDGKEGIVLKRIQPKEKSLYERCCSAGKLNPNPGFSFEKELCLYAEALEKRVEELEKGVQRLDTHIKTQVANRLFTESISEDYKQKLPINRKPSL